MKNKKLKNVIIIIAACLCTVLVTSVCIGIFSDKQNSAGSATNNSAKTYSKVYTHHFDVNIDISSVVGVADTYIPINFNVISSTATPYSKLSDMDGDGYIISAFGVYEYGGQPVAVFDARLVNDGNILIYVTSTSDGSVQTLIVPNMGNYDIHPDGISGDHVTAI